MTHLHLKLFLYINMMWVNIACAALDFSNVNVVTKHQPIGNIDMSNYIWAVTVIKALVSEITIAQSQGSPVIVPRSIISKYCPTVALGQEKNPARTNQVATTPAPQNANTKRDHKTTKDGTSKEPTQQHRKKRQTPGVERTNFSRKDLGMFYLKNLAMLTGAVFPKELATAICVPYLCKGLECPNEHCKFAHPRQAADINMSDVQKIAIHFKMNKHGHLSKYHFRKLTDLSEEVRSVMGSAEGITSSKTN